MLIYHNLGSTVLNMSNKTDTIVQASIFLGTGLWYSTKLIRTQLKIQIKPLILMLPRVDTSRYWVRVVLKPPEHW